MRAPKSKPKARKPRKKKAAPDTTRAPAPVRTREDVVLAVCGRIADGDSMREACKDEGIPASTFCEWAAATKELAARYEFSREVRAEVRADQIDEYVRKVIAGEMPVDAARLAIDTAKWSASKLGPKRYGQRMQHSNDPENPMPVTGVIVVPAKLMDDES
jgi:hypothetical protein